ncbi:hypothetical protein IAT40_007267 [Kwoniella sp. CBS 6097]
MDVSFLLALIITALGLLSTVSSLEVRVGCFDVQVLHGLSGQAYDWWTVPCMDICQAQGTLYAYSWIAPSHNETDHIRQCLCDDVKPSSKWLESDSACPYPYVTVDYLGPPPGWEWYYCFDFGAQGPADPFPVSTLPECLLSCAAYPNAYFLYADRVDNYVCACYQRGPPFTDYQCGVGKAMHYYHTVTSPPTDSIAVKRKRRIEEALEERKSGFEICPTGMRACHVPDEDQVSYECLDTANELESCGGCLYGEISPAGQVVHESPHITGVDCTTLPGVLENGVSCHEGRCIAFACVAGSTLIEDACVPMGDKK